MSSDLFEDLKAGLVLPHELQAERDGRLRAEGAAEALTGIVERQLERIGQQPAEKPRRLRSVG